MPVEIRELIIRAAVAQDRPPSDGREDIEARAACREPAEDREALIQECVRQVLRILQQNKER